MADIPNVRLTLSNRPENVLLVRQALSGLADAIELDPLELNDISTAVSEACNNVALHAYGGEEGPLEVEVLLSPPVLQVTVLDRGKGMPVATETTARAGGIGLPVMHTLAQEVDVRERAGGGTQVRMRFATPRANAVEPLLAADDRIELAEIARSGADDTIAMAIAPTPLARAVLPRVLCALAARANFSTDRIADAELLADALLAHIDGSVDASHICVGVSTGPRSLELRIGPLRSGHTGVLIDRSTVDGLGPVIERLTDGHEVAASGSSELLALRLLQRR